MDENKSIVVFKFVKENESNFTLYEFKDVITKTNLIINKILIEQKICSKSDLKEYNPEITSVRNGSIEISTIVSSVISGLIVEGIIKIFEKTYHHLKGKIINNNEDIVINIIQRHPKRKWTFDDDYYICNEIIKFYIIAKAIDDVSKFINLYLINILNKFEFKSILCKIKNIKYLLENKNISNTLKCSKFSNYSKQNYNAFIKACNDNGIKL